MSRQYNNPYLINSSETQKLEPAFDAFDENWLQKFIFEHHTAIPINEIELAFAPLIPVCRELPTNAGPVDLLFVNNDGLLTLVECKLWKNPEARREVVGQILDYAKEISRWTYQHLEDAIGKTQKTSKKSLFQLVSEYSDVDEQDFIDSVSRNLRRGRFLLLIIGDGIRENVEQMAEFLQKYAYLNFGFALVEFGVFGVPNRKDEYIVQSRLITQTVEIERAVFRIEDNQIVSAAPLETTAVTSSRKAKITEQVFFENLKADETVKKGLKEFFERAENMELYLEPGQNSLKLKSSIFGVNLGIFTTNGEFYNCGISSATEQMGKPQIGDDYLSQLAKLIDNGYVTSKENRFWRTIKVKQGKKDRYATVAEILAVQDNWIDVIQNTLNELSKLDVNQ